MKYYIALIVFFSHSCLIFSQSAMNNLKSPKVFKSIQLYYLDSLQNGTRDWKEMNTIVYFDDDCVRPPKLKVKVNFNDIVLDGFLEVFIEDLIVPDSNFVFNIDTSYHMNRSSYWGLNRVIANYNFKNSKKKFIIIENIDYPIIYFIGSKLFPKMGFRIVAYYISKDKSIKSIITNEFYFPND